MGLARQQLRIALISALVGGLWAYARNGSRRAPLLAGVRALEWFVATGGASLVLRGIADLLDDRHDVIEIERDIRIEEVVSEPRQPVGSR